MMKLSFDDSQYITYWYLFGDEDILELQKTGLLPASMLPKEVQDQYRGRNQNNPHETPDQYFRRMYDKFYKRVLNMSYRHYGIYTTPLDLRGIAPAHSRIRFEINKLGELLVLHHHPAGLFCKPTPEKVAELVHEFTPTKIKHIYTTVTERRFRFMPQIVYFGDVPLHFNKSQIETW
jgi:hypothetical protein